MNRDSFKIVCSIIEFVLLLTPLVATRAADISTSEFLEHCQAAPEPCKNKVLSYVKFLADAGSIDSCVMHLPANDVATKLVGWMREHPDKDWIDSLDTALTALDLCGK
jgi:hypothetical protein